MVDFEIVVGNSKLSVRGELSEVTTLLEGYSHLLSAPVKTPLGEATPSTAETKARLRRPKSNASKATQSEGLIDASALANEIKSSDSFEVYDKKILSIIGKWTDKARLVAYLADKPITSGDVRRVMQALRVKTDLPSVSKALSGISAEFLTEGTNPVTYTMTARARRDFEQSLLAAE
jgi:hypothetical protein